MNVWKLMYLRIKYYWGLYVIVSLNFIFDICIWIYLFSGEFYVFICFICFGFSYFVYKVLNGKVVFFFCAEGLSEVVEIM